jgi:hypothetical protein
MTRSIGMICLCVLLIVGGLMQVSNFSLVYANVVLGILAIAAGILLLLQK